MAFELKIESISDGTVFKQEELVLEELKEPTNSAYYEVIEYESQNTLGTLIPKEESIDIEYDSLYQCIQCKNEFINNNLVVENRCSKCKLAEKNDESDIFGQTFSNDPDPKENNCKNLQCKSCDKIFTTKTDLRDHLRFQCQSSLICPDCGQAFKRNWILKRHMRHHFNEKQRALRKNLSQLICNHCNTKFDSPKLLQSHYFNQESKCGLICVRCGRLFKVSRGLKSHISNNKCEKLLKIVANMYKEDKSKAHIEKQEEVGTRNETYPQRKILKSTDVTKCPSTRHKTSTEIKPVTQQLPKYKAFQYQSILNKARNKSLQKGNEFAAILQDMPPDLKADCTNIEPSLEAEESPNKPSLKRRSNLTKKQLNTIVCKRILERYRLNGYGKPNDVQMNANPELQVNLSSIVPTQQDKNIVISSNTIELQPVIQTTPEQIPKSTAPIVLTKPRILNCKARTKVITTKLMVNKTTTDADASPQDNTKALLQTIPQQEIIAKPKTFVNLKWKKPAHTVLTEPLLLNCKARSTITAPKLLTRKHTTDIDSTLQKITKPCQASPILKTVTIPSVESKKLFKDSKEQHLLNCKARSTINALKFLIRKKSIKLQTAPKQMISPKPTTIPSVELKNPPLKDSTEQLILNHKAGLIIKEIISKSLKDSTEQQFSYSKVSSTIVPKAQIKPQTTDVQHTKKLLVKPSLQETPKKITFIIEESIKPATKDSSRHVFIKCKTPASIQEAKLLATNQSVDTDSTVQKSTQPTDFEKVITSNHLKLKKTEPVLDIESAQRSTEKQKVICSKEPEDFEQLIFVNFLPKNQMQNNAMEV